MKEQLIHPAQEPAGGDVRERLPHPQARQSGYRWRVVELLGLLVFLGLAIPAARLPYFGFDLSVTQEIQESRAPWLDGLMYAISVPGFTLPGAFLVLAAVVLLLLTRFRTEALFVALTSLADVVGQIVKTVVARPRPSSDLVAVLAHEGSGSFPSAHALHYVVFFGFLIYLTLTLLRPGAVRWAIAALLAAPILLVGLSRIYLGDHWLSDVIGGYLIGALWLSLHIQAYRWFKAHFEFVAQAPFVRRRPVPAAV